MGDGNNYFANFCSIGVLQFSIGEGWWGDAESIMWGRLKSHIFIFRKLVRQNLEAGGIFLLNFYGLIISHMR